MNHKKFHKLKAKIKTQYFSQQNYKEIQLILWIHKDPKLYTKPIIETKGIVSIQRDTIIELINKFKNKSKMMKTLSNLKKKLYLEEIKMKKTKAKNKKRIEVLTIILTFLKIVDASEK